MRSPRAGPQSPFNILSHCPMWWSYTCCLSPFSTKSHQNSAKDCKTNSFKNERFLYFLFIFNTACFTPRIGKFCQNKDDMTSKSSRGKKHCSEVFCSLFMFCCSLSTAVGGLSLGVEITERFLLLHLVYKNIHVYFLTHREKESFYFESTFHFGTFAWKTNL